MALEVIESETGPEPSSSIIVLHRLGADGNAFVPICGELDLSAVGPVRFVFPHAPTRPVTINGGYVMRAWYDILGTQTDLPENETGLRQSPAVAHGGQTALPIFMAHGRYDPVIPIARAIASRDALSALGHPVEWHEYPMQHSVCAEEIVDLNRWLLRV